MGDGEAGLTSAGNCDSTFGDRRSMMTLLFLAPFDVDLVVVVADDILADGVVESLMVWCVGGGSW